jgi:sulfur-carrier protein adenylyltransferase/sulfurtransferase
MTKADSMTKVDQLQSLSSAHALGFREVTVRQLSQALGGVRIIDVREAPEFTGELGHIPGAELVPLATVERVASTWAKDEPLVLVCRSGGRSARACGTLVSLGFSRVMNMAGGMLAWNEAALAVDGR